MGVGRFSHAVRPPHQRIEECTVGLGHSPIFDDEIKDLLGRFHVANHHGAGVRHSWRHAACFFCPSNRLLVFVRKRRGAIIKQESLCINRRQRFLRRWFHLFLSFCWILFAVLCCLVSFFSLFRQVDVGTQSTPPHWGSV